MNPVPWQPPAFLYSRQEKELWNAILSYRDHALTPDGWDTSFRFTAIDAPDPATPALLIQPEKGPRFIAVVGSFPFAEIFGTDLEINDFHKLPPALRSCLEEGIVSTLWSTIPDSRMGKARIVTSGMLERLVHQFPERKLQWLSISIEGIAPEPVTVSVGLTIATCVSTIANGSFASAAIESGLARVMETEAYYTLGSLSISFAEFAKLEPGDVVVLPELPADRVLLRSQGHRYTFHFNNKNWVCLGNELTERYRPTLDNIERTNAMSHENAHSDDRDRDTSVRDLTELGVVIDFDLGRMSIPLAQVQAWQGGVVIPLDPPLSSEGVEVTIRANGQIIGSGDLVRIDDRVGVRITRLISK
jgi:flagellar motor switch/type III secretory pathway protein FliN